jgi:hypothetical protein
MSKSLPLMPSWLWRYWKLLIAIGILLLAVLLLPTILGSRWIYQPLLSRFEAGEYRLQIDSVRFRWFSPLAFRGVSIKPLEGPALFTVREVTTDRGLFGYIMGGRRLGRVDVFDPTIDVELLNDGSNLQKLISALEGREKKEPGKVPTVDVDIHVHNFSAIVHRPTETKPLLVVPPFDVQLQYRAADGESTLDVPPTTLLNQVTVTPELVRLGLGHAIPILAKSAWFDGQVALMTEAIHIPLSNPVESTGRATLTLHQMRSGPSDPSIVKLLDIIAQLRKKDPQHELVFVDGSQVEIVVENGKVRHQGLAMGLPRVDPRLQISSQGLVGLTDKSLDLLMEIPVPIEQIARRDSVKEMGVPTIRLPIVGTLEKPEVQWTALRENSADLIGMIRERVEEEAPGTGALLGALEGLAGGQADEAISVASDLIKELRKRREADASKNVEPANEEDKQSPESTQPIRDRLRKIFQGNNKNK